MKRTFWRFLLPVLGLLAVTLACVVPTVVVEVPTASPEATGAPSTDTPVPPTATPVPPTVTLISPTDTPPSPTDTPTPIPAADQVVTEAIGDCAHPYYPVRSDTVWSYQTRTGGGAPTAYAVTFDDIGADAFTSSQGVPGSQVESVWLCSDEGLVPTEIVSFMFFEIPGFEFETLDSSGALLPPAREWMEGTAWDLGYMIQATTRVFGLAVRSQVDVSVVNEIVGEEQVVVPAGIYPKATRIDSTGTAFINAPGMQTEAPFVFSHWYVEGLGLVRLTAEVQGTPFEMQLEAVEQ